MAVPPPKQCWTDCVEAFIPSPVGPLPVVAADSGFAAGPIVSGAATMKRSRLQDLASAEATDEVPVGPRATPTVQPSHTSTNQGHTELRGQKQ